MKRTEKTQRTEFVFFKDNLKANRFTLTLEEIKEKYLLWLKSKDTDWVQYYGHGTVLAFISDKEGLSATSDENYFDELEDVLMKVRHSLQCYK